MMTAALTFCPICQLPIDRSAVLEIAAPLPRWTVICIDGAWAHVRSHRDGLQYVVYMADAAVATKVVKGQRVLTIEAQRRANKKE